MISTHTPSILLPFPFHPLCQELTSSSGEDEEELPVVNVTGRYDVETLQEARYRQLAVLKTL